MERKTEKSDWDRTWDRHLAQVRSILELLEGSIPEAYKSNGKNARILIEDSIWQTKKASERITSKS